MKEETISIKIKDLRARKHAEQAGFSFVELMVVVFIMGLLATLLIVNLGGVNEKSMLSKSKADLATLESALEQYSLDAGSYPTQQQGLNALRTRPNDLAEDRYRRGGYLKRLQKDPWGNVYLYNRPGRLSGGSYDVYSAGPDGRPNTEDDVLTWD